MRHMYASGLFWGEKDQSEQNIMYAHLDVLSARSKAVKQRVNICTISFYLILTLVVPCLEFMVLLISALENFKIGVMKPIK